MTDLVGKRVRILKTGEIGMVTEYAPIVSGPHVYERFTVLVTDGEGAPLGVKNVFVDGLALPDEDVQTRYQVPQCIEDFRRGKDWVLPADHDNSTSWAAVLVWGVGRSLNRLRFAARMIRQTLDINEVDYHIYAGVSSAQTVIDAFGLWLNIWLAVGESSGPRLDLTRKRFRDAVERALPSSSRGMVSSIDTLARLRREEIDKWRHLVQHREGFSLKGQVAQRAILPNGQPDPRPWVIAWTETRSRRELWGAGETEAAAMLDGWAAQLEKAVCDALHHAPSPDDVARHKQLSPPSERL